MLGRLEHDDTEAMTDHLFNGLLASVAEAAAMARGERPVGPVTTFPLNVPAEVREDERAAPAEDGGRAPAEGGPTETRPSPPDTSGRR